MDEQCDDGPAELLGRTGGDGFDVVSGGEDEDEKVQRIREQLLGHCR